jgi:hypothetical protein
MHSTGSRRSVKSAVFAIVLLYASLRGVSACDESDEQPTPLPFADLVAPPPDASTDASTDGATAGDATNSGEGAVDGADAGSAADADSATQTSTGDAGDSDAGDF